MSQHEEANAAHIALRTILHAKHGGLMSGGRVTGFERGWGLFGLGHGKAHHGTALASERLIASACGLVWPLGAMVFAEGNWPRCKRCQRIVS